MILHVSFPAMAKVKIVFSSLLHGVDPDTKIKCDQLTEVLPQLLSLAANNSAEIYG